ncbi:putative S-adenosyl-L-methionine-dependent methyltransferase [Dillenia turbinata]|uniref:Methyltransferase n=1 Tax=Dillenia turbinata TaxID=194707 RepID=A0AAN8W1Z2_9MAGN
MVKMLFLEINGMLRTGGYLPWVTEPVHSQEEKVDEQWKELVKEGNIAIWRKPLNNSCYISHDPNIQPPMCDIDDDPDNVWYVSIKACITHLPESESENGANVICPMRFHNPPSRLQSTRIDSYIARKDLFKAETKFWFAAALKDFEFDAWVINVVPVSEFNTLPIMCDCRFLGVMHDW